MCEICNLLAADKIYIDRDFAIIQDKQPVIVYRFHSQDVSTQKIKYIKEISKQIFGDGISFREGSASHGHWHIYVEGNLIHGR